MSKRVVSNNYEFNVDEVTGTTVTKGSLQNEKALRNNSLQSEAGGELRESNHQGGHLVASALNGPAIPENTFAQDAHLNQSQFKTIENAERRLLSDTENVTSIQTERTAYMSNPQTEKGAVPSTFMINDSIHYSNGTTENVHFSFSNMTVQQQEGINQELVEKVDIDMENPGDTLRESMSPEEYATLMEETDAELPNIRDEFDGNNVNYSFQEEQASMETNTTSLESAETGNTKNWEFSVNDYEGIQSESTCDYSIEADAGASVSDDCGVDNSADASPDCNCE